MRVFSNAAVGETFSVLVSVTNESDAPVQGVRLQVDMQAGGPDASHPLEYVLSYAPESDASAPPAVVELAPRARLTLVARHEIGTMAQHALVCRVRCDLPTSGEEHWMTKYVPMLTRLYKFSVQPPPIALHTTSQGVRSRALAMHPDVRVRERVYIQVQVHNVSPRPVVLEELRLDTQPANDAWTWHLVDALDTGSTARHLQPKDVRQYVFVLAPSSEAVLEKATLAQLAAAPADKRLVSVVHPLGTIVAHWRVPNAEPGVLKIGPIQRGVNMPVPPALDGLPRLFATAHLAALPQAFVAEAAAELTVHVAVHALDGAQRTYDLALVAADGTWLNMSLLGPAYRAIPHVTEHAEVRISVLPLKAGVVQSGGMALMLTSYTEGATTVPVSPPHILREWPCFVELVTIDTG